MTLCEKVQRACEKCGKTVAGLERELGYARGTIAKWDDHIPSVMRVQEVATALSTTVDALLNGGD